MFHAASFFLRRIFLLTPQGVRSRLHTYPFRSEIFTMMAASTFGLAYGGPDRMCYDQGSPSTTIMDTTTSPASIADGGAVKGWLFYDPRTEGFRPSSIDREDEGEEVAAQNLVDACEQALDDASATMCGCEKEVEEDDEEEEDHGEGLSLRSSFSFTISNGSSSTSSPSVSPFSDVHGKSEAITSSTTTHPSDCEDMRKQSDERSSLIVNGSSSDTSSSPSPPRNKNNNVENNRGNSGLTFFPTLRETWLGGHRGSVMEAGVVLDTRIFGGIGIVQSGRKVDVRKSMACVDSKSAGEKSPE